jgi:catechol 2,3-dioxygenase-like lactoylglutathione lyase family enzyme
VAYLALEHVQLAMPPGGEDAARWFYTQVLRMEETPKPGPLMASGGIWLRAGPAEIHLGVELDFQPARKAHPGLQVDDLEAMAERCEAAGHAPQWDERYPGRRRFYLADPFGNRLELFQLDS